MNQNAHKNAVIPFACLKTRAMLHVLVSQTLTMPSSVPEANRNPSLLKAKHVIALLYQRLECVRL